MGVLIVLQFFTPHFLRFADGDQGFIRLEETDGVKVILW